MCVSACVDVCYVDVAVASDPQIKITPAAAQRGERGLWARAAVLPVRTPRSQIVSLPVRVDSLSGCLTATSAQGLIWYCGVAHYETQDTQVKKEENRRPSKL